MDTATTTASNASTATATAHILALDLGKYKPVACASAGWTIPDHTHGRRAPSRERKEGRSSIRDGLAVKEERAASFSSLFSSPFLPIPAPSRNARMRAPSVTFFPGAPRRPRRACLCRPRGYCLNVPAKFRCRSA
jgi:hypothetical protein